MSNASILRAAVLACALAALPSLAFADAIEEKNVVSGKAAFDPAKGYIYVQAPSRWNGMFLREPDESTLAAYKVDADKAFAKAMKSYQSNLRSWEVNVAAARQTKSKEPEKPVEPVREGFSIGPIETRDSVSFGPMFTYAKSDAGFGYMMDVKPGTYTFYGPVFTAPNGSVAGSCDCMGSVRFEVKPGVVTDLGNFLLAAPFSASPFDVASADYARRMREKAAKSGKPYDPPPRVPVAFGLPASLAKWPSVQAEFHAAGKMNNYWGATVTRMAPINGVLSYDRDRVIDERTGQEVKSRPIETQVKVKN